MDDIHYKRLRWMTKAYAGEVFPEELFKPNDWGDALNETAQAALDEIARLEKRIAELESKDEAGLP